MQKVRFFKFNSTTQRTRCSHLKSNTRRRSATTENGTAYFYRGFTVRLYHRRYLGVGCLTPAHPMRQSKQTRTDIILFIKNRDDATLRGQQSRSFKRWTASCQGETGITMVFARAIQVLLAFKISISLHSGGGELKLSSSHNERIGGTFFASSLHIHLHLV